MLLLAVVTSAAAGSGVRCPGPVAPAQLDDTLTAAESAFGALDDIGFDRAVDDAVLALPCLEAVVPASIAAHYHRVVGLSQLESRDRDAARASFVASRALEPERPFPVELLPEGKPARDVWNRAPPAGPLAPIPPPRVGSIAFDGTPLTGRPTDHPAILQLVDASGISTLTRYLLPTDPLPPYELALAPPAPFVPEPAPALAPVLPPPAPPPPEHSFGVHPLWATGAAVAGLSSGLLYALAGRTSEHFAEPDPSVSLARLEGQRRTANTLVASSGVAAGAAVGGLVAAIVAGSRD